MSRFSALLLGGVLSLSVQASTLEQYFLGNPNWQKDNEEVLYVAIRCEAITGLMFEYFRDDEKARPEMIAQLKKTSQDYIQLMFMANKKKIKPLTIDELGEKSQVFVDFYVKEMKQSKLEKNSIFSSLVQSDYTLCYKMASHAH